MSEVDEPDLRRWLRTRAGLVLVAIAALFWTGRLFASWFWFLDLLTHFTFQAALGSALVATLYVAVGGAGSGSRRRVVPLVLGVSTCLMATADVLRLSPSQRRIAWTAGDRVETPGGNTARLRIAVANVRSSNLRKDLVIEWLRRESPDLFVLIEIDQKWVEGISEFADLYPFAVSHPDDRGNFGIGCWSRIPLDVSRGLFGLGGDLPQLDLSFRADGLEAPIRLLGTHPPPPVNAGATAERDRLIAAYAQRARESREAGERVLVLGDLNCSRFSPVVRRLAESGGLVDASAAQALPGFRTWPATPLGRVIGTVIDHCFVDPRITVERFEVGPSVGSDHFPLIVDLLLRD